MRKQKLIIPVSFILFLASCESKPTSVFDGKSEKAINRSEIVTTVTLAPHEWRNDRDCYAAGTTMDSNAPFLTRVSAVKWRKSRQFHGYLYTNFEGWSFVVANRNERPGGLGEGRYQTDIYPTDDAVPFAPEPRTYWLEFVGAEALCNSQSPEDATFDVPLSRNLVRLEKVAKLERVH